MRRREFLIKTVHAGTALAIPVVLSCSKEDDDDDLMQPGESLTIDLDSAQYSDLKNAGNAVTINNIIVANLGNEKFVALSAICTHQGCNINYNHSTGNFPCPCHGTVFSDSGSVLQGPATTPVKRFTITRENNVLTIRG